MDDLERPAAVRFTVSIHASDEGYFVKLEHPGGSVLHGPIDRLHEAELVAWEVEKGFRADAAAIIERLMNKGDGGDGPHLSPNLRLFYPEPR